MWWCTLNATNWIGITQSHHKIHWPQQKKKKWTKNNEKKEHVFSWICRINNSRKLIFFFRFAFVANRDPLPIGAFWIFNIRQSLSCVWFNYTDVPTIQIKNKKIGFSVSLSHRVFIIIIIIVLLKFNRNFDMCFHFIKHSAIFFFRCSLLCISALMHIQFRSN